MSKRILYLKAVWNRRTADGIQKCDRLLSEAIEIDDSYAIAHAGSPTITPCLPFTRDCPRVLRGQSEAFAEKAIELDTRSPRHTHHTALRVEPSDWQWTKRDAAYQRSWSQPVLHAVVQYLAMNLFVAEQSTKRRKRPALHRDRSAGCGHKRKPRLVLLSFAQI